VGRLLLTAVQALSDCLVLQMLLYKEMIVILELLSLQACRIFKVNCRPLIQFSVEVLQVRLPTQVPRRSCRLRLSRRQLLHNE